MGVLIEALSVVVPVVVLEAKYAGGVARYGLDAPNHTFCNDGTLTRLGFMTPPDVLAHVDHLKARGLRFHGEEGFVDMASIN